MLYIMIVQKGDNFMGGALACPMTISEIFYILCMVFSIEL